VRSVVILGSTGSIGTQALDVVARNRGDIEVLGLAAGGASDASVRLLAQQAAQFDVATVALADPQAGPAFVDAFATLAPGQKLPQILAGAEAATQLAATPCDVVLNGITGSIGLLPTLAALKAGTTLALANKESLIVGGPLVKAVARPDQIVPVDSEHSALAQCLRAGRTDEVRRLILTASGGPFRGLTREALSAVTPEQALAHPTWSMGPVVTINSATLMNKGLEVIEAHLLFDVPFASIDVVVHPQSIVHSMVEFIDGSTMAQVSPPDMRLPIALGLSWPERINDAAPANRWDTSVSWTFEPLDDDAFPAVALAREAGGRGGTAPAVFNAANEVCVEEFLAGRLPFLAIVDTVAQVLGDRPADASTPSLDDVLGADAWARARARELTAGVGVR
jgi:1-deoxy-D-xylulose-5-phosphate reductoisomerase